MPRLLAPHKSGLHRQACLSLYRSLLRTGTRVGTSTGNEAIPDTVRSLIRYRFHKDRSLLSQSQVANGLRAGHGYLFLLQQCAEKSTTALDQLSRILEQVKFQAEATSKYRANLASRWKPPPPSLHAHLQNLRRIADKANHISTSTAPSSVSKQPQQRIFQHPRPLSEVKSGVRKVPNLILAQGIPLLKYPGPTPVIVNRVLKEKILWGIRKWEQHKELEGTIELARLEDEWDEILAKSEGIVAEDEVEVVALGEKEEKGSDAGAAWPRFSFYDPMKASASDASSSRQQQRTSPLPKARISWTTQLREVDRMLEKDVLERGKQYALLGNRLFHEVVVKERELKEQERKEKKHTRRMARKQAGSIFGAEGDGESQEEPPSSVASGFI